MTDGLTIQVESCRIYSDMYAACASLFTAVETVVLHSNRQSEWFMQQARATAPDRCQWQHDNAMKLFFKKTTPRQRNRHNRKVWKHPVGFDSGFGCHTCRKKWNRSMKSIFCTQVGRQIWSVIWWSEAADCSLIAHPRKKKELAAVSPHFNILCLIYVSKNAKSSLMIAKLYTFKSLCKFFFQSTALSIQRLQF